MGIAVPLLVTGPSLSVATAPQPVVALFLKTQTYAPCWNSSRPSAKFCQSSSPIIVTRLVGIAPTSIEPVKVTGLFLDNDELWRRPLD